MSADRAEEALRVQVKQCLASAGISQARAAATLGMTAKHMSQMLIGRSTLTLGWAERIVELCGHRLLITVDGRHDTVRLSAELHAAVEITRNLEAHIEARAVEVAEERVALVERRAAELVAEAGAERDRERVRQIDLVTELRRQLAVLERRLAAAHPAARRSSGSGPGGPPAGTEAGDHPGPGVTGTSGA